MTELEHAIKHIKTRADAWAVKEVTEALRSISERLDKALSQEPCEDVISRQAVLNLIEKGECLSNGAVKKLPSVNPQPCDDAISREWLMRKATERFYTTNYFNHISAMIEEAPSVTQKSGKWIKTPKAVMGEGYMWYCSECEYEVYQDSSRNYPSENYCPNCGAKMESEEQTE